MRSDVPIGVVPPVPVMAIVRMHRLRIGDGANAERAADAAQYSAHGAADHRADWSGRLVADISSVRSPFGNALGLRRQRRNERCGHDASK